VLPRAAGRSPEEPADVRRDALRVDAREQAIQLGGCAPMASVDFDLVTYQVADQELRIEAGTG
jgi:hypothetical protein